MSDSARFESTYTDYNRILRTWFVAFGAGAPGVLLFSDDSRELISAVENSERIIWALAIGVGLQILIAVLNKYIAWCNAYVMDIANSDNSELNVIIKFVADLTDQIWIDFIFDLITLCLFGYAIFRLFGALV